MKHQVKLIALALCALGSTGAQAVSFTQNDVTLDINGTINGYYVNRDSTATDKNGATTKTTNSALSNGLLPGWINFVVTTKVEDLDIKAHVSFAPGINSNSQVVGLPIGNNAGGAGTVNPYSQIDTRNLYFSFGNANMGTVKFGRDIGLFGQDIILSDMTLIGVGGTSNASIPYNTTFGMIGHGYMYTGFQAQISYTTPSVNGFQASAGIFQPSKFAGDETKNPGFQAKADYTWAGAAPGKVWVGMVTQNTDCSSASTCNGATVNSVTTTTIAGVPYFTVNTTQNPGAAFRANGQEIGAKASFGNLGLVAYTFSAKGLGLSTVGAQFLGGSDGTGNRTESKGYFLQGTYQVTPKTKIGLNFGQNTDKNGAVSATTDGELKNKAFTLGAYHSLNKYVTLVAEYNQEKHTHSVDSANTKNDTMSLGGIIFF